MIKKCPDCGGDFEEGAIMDYLYGGVIAERYAKASLPEGKKSILMAEADFQDIRRVITYRCVECNRLFSYAQDIVIAKNIWSGAKKRYLIMFLFFLFILLLILTIGLIGTVFFQ